MSLDDSARQRCDLRRAPSFCLPSGRCGQLARFTAVDRPRWGQGNAFQTLALRCGQKRTHWQNRMEYPLVAAALLEFSVDWHGVHEFEATVQEAMCRQADVYRWCPSRYQGTRNRCRLRTWSYGRQSSAGEMVCLGCRLKTVMSQAHCLAAHRGCSSRELLFQCWSERIVGGRRDNWRTISRQPLWVRCPSGQWAVFYAARSQMPLTCRGKLVQLDSCGPGQMPSELLLVQAHPQPSGEDDRQIALAGGCLCLSGSATAECEQVIPRPGSERQERNWSVISSICAISTFVHRTDCHKLERSWDPRSLQRDIEYRRQRGSKRVSSMM